MSNHTISHISFSSVLKNCGITLERNKIELLQMNITKRCNQECIHCHVSASPTRREEMSFATMEKILQLLKSDHCIETVDITGGAPELNANFRYLVSSLRRMDIAVIDRCNLTVLHEKGQEDTAEFLAENKVSIFASLPCYLEQNVDRQRGSEVFQKSINALQKLNRLGYGKKDLILNLIHNPIGNDLPGNQQELEMAYKSALEKDFGITFHHLFAITNMPVNRYRDFLDQEGEYEKYLELLASSFNPSVADKIMCKNQISVSWDGTLYDCDFSQALCAPLCSEKNSVYKINSFSEVVKAINYGDHCYGCTAGHGSSCQGKLSQADVHLTKC